MPTGTELSLANDEVDATNDCNTQSKSCLVPLTVKQHPPCLPEYLLAVSLPRVKILLHHPPITQLYCHTVGIQSHQVTSTCHWVYRRPAQFYTILLYYSSTGKYNCTVLYSITILKYSYTSVIQRNIPPELIAILLYYSDMKYHNYTTVNCILYSYTIVVQNKMHI